MSKIICIGSSAKDIFFPTDEGGVFDTPEDLTSQKKLAFELGAKYQIDEIYSAPGGCATNVAQGLARLGVETGIYTKLGKDAIGNWIKDELKKEGVNTDLIQVDENCKSDLSAIVVDKKSKDHIIFFNRDSNDKLSIDTSHFDDIQWVFVSALNGDWEKHLDRILEFSKQNNIKIAFNPGQKNIQDNKKKVIEFIKGSEVLILNKDEAIEILADKQILNEEDFNDEKYLIEELSNLGVGTIGLTDGSRGAWAYKEGNLLHADIVSLNPLDTLGAGDAFTSAFLSALIKEKKLEKCLQWGSLNSGSVVLHYGAKEGLLTSGEIEKKINDIIVEELN